MASLPLALGVFAASFLLGAMPSLMSSLKPFLQRNLALDQDRVDRLERRQYFLSWVVGMPLAGWLVDAWSVQDVMVFGSAGIALVLSFFGLAQTPNRVRSLSFALGIATSFLAVSTLCLVPAALDGLGSHAARMNLAFIAVGIGSFTPYLIFSRLERILGYRQSLLLLGLGALIPPALVIVAPNSLIPISQGASTAFLNEPLFWLLAVALLLYYPIESALDIWSEPFLNELGYVGRSGRFLLIGFWVLFLGARLATYKLMPEGWEPWILFWGAMGSAIFLGNLVGAYGASSGGIGFWLVGAAYGPLLPGFLGLIYQATESASPGLALGCLLALAGLHDGLFQPAFQRAPLAGSVRLSMRLPLVLTLFMLAPLLVVALIR